MADPFVAEIRIFPFNFPPRGWAWCDGQLLPLSQNTALFALLGTMYGGNGQSNFALPDLQGRAPMHHGQSTTGTLYDVGQAGGTETVTLLETEIPQHAHAVRADSAPAARSAPAANPPASPRLASDLYQTTTNASLTTMAATALVPMGSAQPHNNLQPYLTFYFCIALQGVFPPRW